MKISTPIQKSLFEDDYLVRTLGRIGQIPDVALVELVANAWDAGASEVTITIPEAVEELLTITDDGCGLTPDQFHKRWMKLGYNRIRHQGEMADLPPARKDWKRRAYGRNGVGRHGLLCFGDEYCVETVRDGTCGKYVVAMTSGESPFALLSEEIAKGDGNGTTLSVKVQRHRPEVERIRELLSRKFLHDPQFTVVVNKRSISLAEHTGLLDQCTREIAPGVTVEMFAIQSPDSSSSRFKQHNGIAFWVGSRLVGEPSWRLGDRLVLDRRTTVSRCLTIVVRTNDLYEEVESDWTGFRDSPIVEILYNVVSDYVEATLRTVLSDRISETRTIVIRDHREALAELKPHARLEVAEFLNEVTNAVPTASSDLVSVAVKAVINLEKTRSGQDLLRKLSQLASDDVSGINRLLDNWTVRDALAVLDEIDRRICVVEALAKLIDDPDADELHTIHPLVTQARWLFGPEYESPLYSSNVTIRKAAEKVFKKKIDVKAIVNPKKRPDLIFLKDATMSLVATEDDFAESPNVLRLKNLLLIELKKGDATIRRDAMRQAENYVDDLLNCKLLDGPPFIHAFVVGHKVDGNVRRITVGNDPIVGRIEPCSFGQLVRTARTRLFNLQNHISERYENVPGLELVERVLHEPTQKSLLAAE